MSSTTVRKTSHEPRNFLIGNCPHSNDDGNDARQAAAVTRPATTLVAHIIVWLSLGIGVPALAQNDADGFPSFAFPTTSLTFSNGGTKLAGLLMKPTGKGPFPAVVILHGAGSATHNEPAYRVHANAFACGGFAVLLYDKRGSGKSSGDLDWSDFDDLAGDAAAGVTYLRSRDDINAEAIGFLGRSEGGWIGPIAAARDSRIAFVIMSSGAAVRPIEQVRWWMRGLFQSKGAPTVDIEAALDACEAQWEYYRRVARDPIWARSVAGVARHNEVDMQMAAFRKVATEFGKQAVANPTNTSALFFAAFTRKMDFDPLPSLMTMRAPLLDVIGGDEDVVEPASTIAVLESLKTSGHDVAVKVLPKVGHPLIVMTPAGPRYPDD